VRADRSPDQAARGDRRRDRQARAVPGQVEVAQGCVRCYGSRKVREKVTVVDEGKAINFLLENRPSAVAHVSKYKIVLDVAKAAVKDHLTATGEVPDGFAHVGERRSYFIKPDA
jgi:intracellular sulfur oxidation DsrE/DsrF family protein